MGESKTHKHPATVLLDRIGSDGLPKPFSISEQWKQVADWHSFMEADRASDYPVLEGLNGAWNELEPLYEINGKCFIERGEALRQVSDSPLSTLFYFIDMGFYPPPELLLTLFDCWQTYTGGSGKISLEDAFFGPVKKGVGNHSARKNSRFRLMWLRWEFDRLLHEGKSRTEAAEVLSERMGGKPDVESILRMLRGFNGLFAKHQEQAEK